MSLEPTPLHYGEPEGSAPHPLRYAVLNGDDEEVGVVFSEVGGTYRACVFGHEPRFIAFKIDQLLVICGLWLAYQESVTKP